MKQASLSQPHLRIPRTFVFDRKIDPRDYDKYISKEDLLNESFEQAIEDF